MKNNLPKDIFSFLGAENKRYDFQKSFSEYIIFYNADEVEKVVWEGIEAYSLIKEVEGYSAEGLLVWIPKFDSLGSIDFEHDVLSLLEGIAFSTFIEEPDVFLADLVDGVYEVELEGLLHVSNEQYVPDSSMFGELIRRIQLDNFSKTNFNFVCRGEQQYSERIGESNFDIRYWHHKEGTSRLVYASFSGYVPNCDYEANIGEYRYTLKNDEFVVPDHFYMKVEELFKDVYKKHPFLFNKIESE